MRAKTQGATANRMQATSHPQAIDRHTSVPAAVWLRHVGSSGSSGRSGSGGSDGSIGSIGSIGRSGCGGSHVDWCQSRGCSRQRMTQ